MWRFAARRADELGVNFDEMVEELSSRSTAWRVRKEGATPQLLEKVESRLSAIEESKGLKSTRGEMLKAWSEIGAELLLLDDEGLHFRQASGVAKDVLSAGKKLHEALSVFRKK